MITNIRTTLAALIVGSLALSATAAFALSLAEPKQWEPATITAPAELLYTGNSLLLDATTSTMVNETSVYPFNGSSATLNIPHPSGERSSYFAYLTWGVAQKSTATFIPSGAVLLTLPSGVSHSISAISEKTKTAGEWTIRYYVADISHLPIESGNYIVAAPELSDSRVEIAGAGWSLITAVHNSTATPNTITAHWNDTSVESDLNGILFSIDPNETDDSFTIYLPEGQTRNPTAQFTRLSDLVLGEFTSAHMFLGDTDTLDSQALLNAGMRATSVGNSESGVSATISYVNPGTQEETLILETGSLINIQVTATTLGSSSVYNSEVRIPLPDYFVYQPGSLKVLLGSMNSGVMTDREDEDHAYYDAASKTIVWKPGSTAVVTSSRPYLLKPGDAPQYFEFQVLLSHFPSNAIPRLVGSTVAQTGPNRFTPELNFTVMGSPTVNSETADTFTDLQLSYNIVPKTPLQWETIVTVHNPGPISAGYKISVPLPEQIVLQLDSLDSACAYVELIGMVECVAKEPIMPKSTNVYSYNIIMLDTDTSYEWKDALIAITTPNVQDGNLLNNNAYPDISTVAFSTQLRPSDDTYNVDRGQIIYSDISLLNNDIYNPLFVEIVVVQEPKSGVLKIKEEGNFEYQSQPAANTETDTFTYVLRNTVTGEKSNAATVSLIFGTSNREN